VLLPTPQRCITSARAIRSPFSPAQVHASLRRATSFQAIRRYLGRRSELLTRPPSEAVDLTWPQFMRLITQNKPRARKLMEIANSVEPVQDGRIHIELIDWPSRKPVSTLRSNAASSGSTRPQSFAICWRASSAIRCGCRIQHRGRMVTRRLRRCSRRAAGALRPTRRGARPSSRLAGGS